jgi:Ca2+/H+ antiporter
MKIGRFEVEPLLLLLIFVPIAIVLEFAHANPVWIFVASSLAIIPLAGLMRKATEHLAERLGAGLGGLLNASFGNAAEHSTAVLMAAKNQMDLAMNIAVGSSIQIALFVAPVLVFVGYLLGQPMNLLFTTFERVSPHAETCPERNKAKSKDSSPSAQNDSLVIGRVPSCALLN